MYETLKILYDEYGGFGNLLRSGYFWTAVAFCAASSFFIGINHWQDVAIGALPSLAGFSIASYALIFSALSREQIVILIKKDDEGDSPLLYTAATIVHAIFIQVLTLVLASMERMANQIDPSYTFCNFSQARSDCIDFLLSSERVIDFIGVFLVHYSFLLVLAAALSLFRMLVIISK